MVAMAKMVVVVAPALTCGHGFNINACFRLPTQ